MMELRHTATREGRLSTFLRDEMKMSSGLMNRLKWQQKIFVNSAPQHNDYQVKVGDVISVPLDEEEPEFPAPQRKIISVSVRPFRRADRSCTARYKT